MVRTYAYNPSVHSHIRFDGSNTPLPVSQIITTATDYATSSQQRYPPSQQRSLSLPRNTTSDRPTTRQIHDLEIFHRQSYWRPDSTEKTYLDEYNLKKDGRNSSKSTEEPNSFHYSMDPMEVERRIRENERERQRAYFMDLQKQMEEQRNRNSQWNQINKAPLNDSFTRPRSVRSRYNNPYTQTQSPSSLNDSMSQSTSSRREQTDEPFWLKGSPQPRSGVRGSDGWRNAQRGLEGSTSMVRRNSLPGSAPLPGQPLQQSSNYFHDNIARAINARSNSEYKLHQQRNVLEQQIDERRRKLQGAPVEEYDPWGKGGGGAPVRDRAGNLVADRAKMAKTWTQMTDTNIPHTYSPNNSMNASHGFNNSVSMDPNDSYKSELKKQIEDNRRLKEIEKEKERKQDLEDERRAAEYRAKERREEEEEQNRQRDKAIERERAQAEAAEKAKAEHMMAKRPMNTHETPNRKPAAAEVAEDDGLEWWEKKPGGQTHQSSSSNSAPKSRGRSPSVWDTSESFAPRASSAGDLTGHKTNGNHKVHDEWDEEEPEGIDFRPSSSVLRNEGVMRQMSAMRERLTKEQIRVRSALQRKQYNTDLFSDDETGVEADTPRDNRRPRSSRVRSAVPSQNKSSPRNSARRSRVTSAVGEDLVQLIKSNRTMMPGVDEPNSRPRSTSRSKPMRPPSTQSRW